MAAGSICLGDIIDRTRLPVKLCFTFMYSRMAKKNLQERGMVYLTVNGALTTSPDLSTKNCLGGTMGKVDKGGTASLQELIVSSLAQTDALTKLLIEKGLITQAEFMQKLSAERAGYQAMLGKMG